MGIVIVDGKEIEVGEQERLNGIQIALRAGVNIPHYCWHPGLAVVASCRMCLVESGTRNGETGAIAMVPKLVPACQTPAKDGTVFVTNSDAVKRARAQVEEALLIDHPIDCPICDKAGECHLQDYHFEHGQGERRADIRPFTSRKREMGDTVSLFVDRCVMCSRCVRFCREITGTSELMIINRGSDDEIDVFPGHPLANKLSGCVVDLCPVGALGDRDFLYKQRVWFMNRHLGVCAGCSTGCTIRIDENQDTVYRLTPQENPFINKWWMCDEGRYGYKHLHTPERQVEPRAFGKNIEWSHVPGELSKRLEAACTSGRLAAVVSPNLTVEEAYLLCKLARKLDSEAVLALGPVPVVGEEESFPGKFTIHAEKCPNRKGVEEVLAYFCDGQIKTFDELLEELPVGKIKAAWVSGGYPRGDWCDAEAAEKFTELELLVVQDMFASPLWNVATYQLPGAGFAERAGSYVNYAHRLQSFAWAIRPPEGVWIEGHLYWTMLGMRGLYNARKVMDEVSREIIAFAAAADEVPLVGVDLRVNQLAGAV
jgi:NADH-quinone oxidoreductase subunit G